ncbi:EamA family transporter [Nocardioidaceae bacterium]|nr:EamA family transporter [Nocardioidaceae bacterium]
MGAAIGFALVSAVVYGLSDFAGGVTSRRTSAWGVAVAGAVTAFVVVAAVVLLDPALPGVADASWAVLAGVGSGLGGGFLYRGFAAGQMAVVAPVSAVGAAVLPAVVGFALGERLGLLPTIGVVLALPGILLVSREPGSAAARREARRTRSAAAPRWADGLLDGLLGGAGFGLLFIALGQVTDAAGFAPLAIAQLVGVLTLVAVAGVVGGGWRPDRTAWVGGAVAGTAAAGANLAYQVSVQQGFLTVSAVLTALYPAVTVLLAAAVLRERIAASQGAGLGVCGIAVLLVASGG